MSAYWGVTLNSNSGNTNMQYLGDFSAGNVTKGDSFTSSDKTGSYLDSADRIEAYVTRDFIIVSGRTTIRCQANTYINIEGSDHISVDGYAHTKVGQTLTQWSHDRSINVPGDFTLRTTSDDIEKNISFKSNNVDWHYTSIDTVSSVYRSMEATDSHHFYVVGMYFDILNGAYVKVSNAMSFSFYLFGFKLGVELGPLSSFNYAGAIITVQMRSDEKRKYLGAKLEIFLLYPTIKVYGKGKQEEKTAFGVKLEGASKEKSDSYSATRILSIGVYGKQKEEAREMTSRLGAIDVVS